MFLDMSFPLSLLQIQSIFHDHGVVCIPREGKDVRKLIFENDVLYEYRVSFPSRGLIFSRVSLNSVVEEDLFAYIFVFASSKVRLSTFWVTE